MNLIGLYGRPIAHSLSPAMHNHAFERLQLPYYYQSFDVAPEQLSHAVAAIKALNMTGVNVTIPYKETIIPYLDVLDESAKKIGAVNTIVNQNGLLKGFNTDGQGYVMSLEKEMRIQVARINVVVLGSGGAARGIVYALLKQGCKHVHILSRNAEKAQKIAEDFHDIGEISFSTLQSEKMKPFEVIINTTPVGMYPNESELPIDLTLIQKEHIVSDIVYNPLETRLLQEAKIKGARVHKGLGMFIYQGALAFEMWTGHLAPVEEMYEYVYRKLQNKRNGGL